MVTIPAGSKLAIAAQQFNDSANALETILNNPVILGGKNISVDQVYNGITLYSNNTISVSFQNLTTLLQQSLNLTNVTSQLANFTTSLETNITSIIGSWLNGSTPIFSSNLNAVVSGEPIDAPQSETEAAAAAEEVIVLSPVAEEVVALPPVAEEVIVLPVADSTPNLVFNKKTLANTASQLIETHKTLIDKSTTEQQKSFHLNEAKFESCVKNINQPKFEKKHCGNFFSKLATAINDFGYNSELYNSQEEFSNFYSDLSILGSNASE